MVMYRLRSENILPAAVTGSPPLVRAADSEKSFVVPESLVHGGHRGHENRGVESAQQEAHNADRFSRPAWRRDRRAVRAPRRRHRAPARSDPGVRRTGGMEHGLSLVRRLAELASGTRPGRGP